MQFISDSPRMTTGLLPLKNQSWILQLGLVIWSLVVRAVIARVRGTGGEIGVSSMGGEEWEGGDDRGMGRMEAHSTSYAGRVVSTGEGGKAGEGETEWW